MSDTLTFTRDPPTFTRDAPTFTRDPPRDLGTFEPTTGVYIPPDAKDVPLAGPVGRVLSAGSEAYREAPSSVLTPEYQARAEASNDPVVRQLVAPAAKAAGEVGAIGSAGWTALQAAIAEAAESLGHPEVGRDINTFLLSKMGDVPSVPREPGVPVGRGPRAAEADLRAAADAFPKDWRGPPDAGGAAPEAPPEPPQPGGWRSRPFEGGPTPEPPRPRTAKQQAFDDLAADIGAQADRAKAEADEAAAAVVRAKRAPAPATEAPTAGSGQLPPFQLTRDDPKPGHVEEGRQEPPNILHMPEEDLLRHAEDTEVENHAAMVRAFGSEEAVAEFNRLDRKQNSSNDARAAEGAKEFVARFGTLTPAQEKAAYGTYGEGHDPADIRDIAEAKRSLADDDDQEVARTLTRGMLDAKHKDVLRAFAGEPINARTQVAAAQIETAARELQARGYDNQEIMGLIAGAMERRGYSMEDAAEVLDAYLKARQAAPTGRAPSPEGAVIALPDVSRETPAAETPATETAPTPTKRRPRAITPFVSIPKEPTRLADFLRQPTVVSPGTIHQKIIPGGIKDVGGNIASMGGDFRRRGLRRLINNETGRSINDARIRAWEEGYFPEFPRNGYPPDDDNMLLERLEKDLSGVPQYSEHHREALEAYHHAIGMNHEISRLAGEHGLPTEGITHAQFFDRLHDHLSQDEHAEEHAAQAAAMDSEWDDFMRQTGEDTPDWKPGERYGMPRTFEDLENEYRQEADAGTPGGRATGDARSGSVGQGSDAGAAGVSPGDGGAGDGRRGGEGEGSSGFAAPIDAYHGTPHEFEAFDTAKIGTGEGAQAYGHGLYFAQNPNVAESYVSRADWLYGRQKAQTIYDRLNQQANERGLDNAGWDRLNAQRGFWEKVVLGRSPRAIIDNAKANPDEYGPAELAYIQSLDPSKFTRTGGNLLTVRINAEPEEMLDWDKPLDQQSPQVKAALRSDPKIAKIVDFLEARPGRDGQTLYSALPGTAEERSAALSRAGVKGIRYLDQGSRSAGEGTHNVVVFDHNDIEITHRNGEPVAPKKMTEGEAGKMLAEQRDLFGREQKTPATRAPEPTIRTDPSQTTLPGMGPSAVQAQAARDAAPPRSGQEAPGGLFAPKPVEQPAFPIPRVSKWPKDHDFRDMLAQFPADIPRGPHEHAAEWVLERGNATGHEHIAVVDNRTGEVIHAGTSGMPNFLPFEHGNTMGERDAYTIHHNHPGNRSLSGPDLAMLANPGITHIVAHGHGGDTYYASLGPKIASMPRVTQAGINKAADQMAYLRIFANNITDKLVRPLFDSGSLPPDVANRVYTDVVNRLLQAEGAINYVSTVKLPPEVARPLKKIVEQYYGPDAADRSTGAIQPSERTAGLHQRVEGRPAQGQPLGKAGGGGGGGVYPQGRLLEAGLVANSLPFPGKLVRD